MKIVRHITHMIGTDTILIALFGLMIVSFLFLSLVGLYLALGTIFPELGIRIDQKIRKALKKPPVIILNPWYILIRNTKWSVWYFVLSYVIIFAIVFIIGLIK
jgi:hypothetical protein